MNENQQDTAGSKRRETDNKLWIPPLSTRDQEKIKQIQKHLQKKSLAERMGVAGKTPWDFIQLLLIPLVLTGVGLWFSAQQNQVSLQISERQHQADIQLNKQQHTNDQAIALDQQRETALKTCMDDIKDLLLNKGLGASKKPEDEIRIVARAEVLSALRQLDGERKGTLIQFLSEAGLITDSRNDVIIYLYGANLSGADLHGVDLHGAILFIANLYGAILSRADLSGAKITEEQLKEAKSLKGTIMPDGSRHP